VGDTCHVDVIDRFGNMVSATPSGGWLSSSPVIPDLGFSVNTRLQITWLDDGVPARSRRASARAARSRPRSPCATASPTSRFGTPGGDQQDQWSLIFFLRHALHGMNLQQAIDFPSWHVNHFPASFWPRDTILNRITLESRFPKETIEGCARAATTWWWASPGPRDASPPVPASATGNGKWILKAAGEPARNAGLRRRSIRSASLTRRRDPIPGAT
jgi:gamma-glutamyltranspeptidase/glutathione hydrolase